MKFRRWFLITFTTIMLLDITFDIGKWALGRYSEAKPWASILMIVGFSFLLALAVEYIHRRRSKEERRYEQYLHHKVKVWVPTAQKGKHWESSLCSDCKNFQPDTPDNCLIETVIHTWDRENHIVSVVWECPKFAKEVPA